MMKGKFKVVGLLALGAFAGALTTMQLQATARNSLEPLPLEELRQLAAVFGMVKSDYVEPVDEKKLISDAIGGMVAGLDPHSVYFDKKSFKEFREQNSGRFVGVGIEIGMEDGLVKVVSPIEGSPAFRAGLKPGDLVTKIDDSAVKGLTMDQAVKRMRGEPNTKVVLMVFRKSESRSFPVTIVREEIRTQSVRSKVLEPGYAWLRVSQFQDRTVEDFAKKLEDIYKHGILPHDFSLYLHHPTVTDPSMAPDGCSTFYALAPVAHLGKAPLDWDGEIGKLLEDRILDEIERRLIPDIRSRIVTSFRYAPTDFAHDLSAYQGSAFSLEPTLTQSAWFRTHNRDDAIPNLYFVGAGTHPGAGIPGVVGSAKATAKLMLEDLAR